MDSKVKEHLKAQQIAELRKHYPDVYDLFGVAGTTVVSSFLCKRRFARCLFLARHP